jgi:thiol-disulfide isomerase/thioredoxin
VRGFLKTRGGEFRFLFNALIWSLLILALIHVLAPHIAPDPRADEIKEFTYELVPAKADAVMSQLKGNGGVLFIYASWCSYCRQIMPDLTAALRDGTIGRDRIVFLSHDNSLEALARYLVRGGYQRMFAPYIIGRQEMHRLASGLWAAGSRFDGGIPYLGRFDAKGNLIEEIQGIPDQGRLRALIENASRNTH